MLRRKNWHKRAHVKHPGTGAAYLQTARFDFFISIPDKRVLLHAMTSSFNPFMSLQICGKTIV